MAAFFGRLRAERWRLLSLALASSLPLAVRLLYMRENAIAWRFFDTRGIVSDLAAGFAAALVLAAAFRASRLLFVVLFLLWLGLNVAYYEFMRVYGWPFFLIHAAYALDPTFVAGSGTALTHPLLVAGAAVLLLACLWHVAATPLPLRWRHVLPVALVPMVAVEFLPWSDGGSDWRQRSFVSANVADLYHRVIVPDLHAHPLLPDPPEVTAYLKPDLSGVPILSAAGARRNVVIVFMEGISGGQVPYLAQAQGDVAELPMVGLDALARDDLAFSTFFTHQRQSNRGLYGALCGDLPGLAAGLPKMTIVAEGMPRRCLPRALKDAGYATLFLNATPGVFMQMSKFMRKIGFDRALGDEDYDPALPRGRWGVDDGRLYDIALHEIDGLSDGGRPFFLSLFTSSTHHPYRVPEDFTGAPGGSPRERAWAFADASVARFVEALRARGRLDDTLVILTSDEATPLTEHLLEANWAPMVVLSPEHAAGRVDAAYAQSDIALSVLDYLGLSPQAQGFTGRSMFRRYDRPRTVYAASVYAGRIYEYVEGEKLTTCSEALDDCHLYPVTDGRPFHAGLVRAPGPVVAGAMMHAVRDHSMRPPVALPGS